ncbi:MAG TPA: UDP-N-acetylmuramoyl-L-alanyl-D-glutamate--2,6-diaminopimelate ligase [Phototrophicaceae bacterium]|jgi:UDP-N-acetylmuramoyl-L-alanyl-D-glutamate--2,6-diaminopimelate ligase|nr:UDP-N-acetylmuramoyl-L-alanyl-D-glutamate--2,6-diaminopimelate ligase [Phototrophicaceae bacterium]
MTKTLFELLEAIPDDEVVGVSGDAMVHAPVVESADQVERGGVFVARPGRSVDGHSFIAKAIENGAGSVIGSRPIEELEGLTVPYIQLRNPMATLGLLAAAYHDYPSRDLVVVGVTGTDGKTTTSTLIHSILRLATGGTAGYISTIAADLGGVTADTGLHVTTPEAPAVQQYLAQMRDNGMSHAVLEMTSHGLAQGRLNGVDLDVAVITNVTHEHLDYHGTWENYRDAKGIMFDKLTQSARKAGVQVPKFLEGEAPEMSIPKIGIVNADDRSAEYFAAKPADLIVTYGIENDADVRATNIRFEAGKTFFRVGDEAYFTPLMGMFNIYNCLAAIAATRALGVNVATVQTGLAQVRAVSGRMERIDEGQNFTAMVDFAHTPNALKMALQAARTMLPEGGSGRLIAVFGSAGLRDVEKRRMMAETSAQYADFTILTAEDPRTESLDGILQMMADGCISQGGVEGDGGTFIRVPDRGEAIYQACQMAQPGDIVIACGKGHEQSMCFGTIEYPWDDRDAMHAALKGTPLKTLPTAK